jgi:hypothetical protein
MALRFIGQPAGIQWHTIENEDNSLEVVIDVSRTHTHQTILHPTEDETFYELHERADAWVLAQLGKYYVPETIVD